MAILNDEQTMLRDMAREWADNESPVAAFRRMRDAAPAEGYDPAVWNEIGQMGWGGIVIPEIYGGSEFGYLSLGLVLEQLGRNLVASPLASTAAAATAIVLGGSEMAKIDWLPKIAAGEVVATLAIFVNTIRRRFREAPRQGSTYWARVGAVIGLIAIAIQSLFEFSLQIPGNAAMFCVLAAIAIHRSPSVRSSGSDPKDINYGYPSHTP